MGFPASRHSLVLLVCPKINSTDDGNTRAELRLVDTLCRATATRLDSLLSDDNSAMESAAARSK